MVVSAPAVAVLIVSILVFVELAPGREALDASAGRRRVSILVFVELAPGRRIAPNRSS